MSEDELRGHKGLVPHVALGLLDVGLGAKAGANIEHHEDILCLIVRGPVGVGSAVGVAGHGEAGPVAHELVGEGLFARAPEGHVKVKDKDELGGVAASLVRGEDGDELQLVGEKVEEDWVLAVGGVLDPSGGTARGAREESIADDVGLRPPGRRVIGDGVHR
mmetsp:Transcript_14885/g.34416  ORF Transcript_14885/g.34416 Transcript_14885/m.34416 type:complete len:162 (-) Transcript_14885:369-854(-)